MPNVNWRCVVHGYVECRTRGGAWWLYARPTLPPDDELAARLVGAGVEDRESPLNSLGVPRDASMAVRDEYTWRVAGPAGGDAPNIVSVAEAQDWIARRRARAWPTTEGFARVTDPRWSNATWMDTAELSPVLSRHEASTGEPAPAAYCALLAMMRALERDYLVRLVLWLERRLADVDVLDERPHRAPFRELEYARAAARARRARNGRRVRKES